MVSVVLQGGPSDHKPVIQSWVLPSGEKINTVTYNVHHSSSADELKDIFREIDNHDVSVWLLQEAKVQQGVDKLLESMGFEVLQADPEFMIAYDPALWGHVRDHRPQMSPVKYWTINYALVAVLRFLKTGEKVKYMTYHTPAHVQSPTHRSYKRVLQVFKDAAAKWNRMARRSKDQDIVANIFAGDDNADETRGHTPKGGWEFALKGPLKQLQAPESTHGKRPTGRKIDDYRYSGVRPTR